MDDNKKFLIVGLGNAEDQYSGTRHNIGFEVLVKLAKQLDVTFKSDRYAYVARAKYKGRTLILIMPTTFMNLSGKAVKYWMEVENIDAQHIMVVSDDLDLPPGQLRIRPKGGGGSHNGLNHIIQILGHGNYPRLRFGIGKNFPQGYQVDYVLGTFTSEERSIIDPAIEKAAEICKSFATAGLQRTMNQFNTKEADSK
ncbi:MAG TPA: aminoacyl-tRNA hydrolase [Bacteroidales bacterium]|jgi:PTH1 family peptidyl-tRNA hydrolase|nr:aminoacyl-tRNA hydrolase [Bacteroidales bacterium]HPE41067.1 aminoacyl-tRNA hydrolase [Bacteroidales bacterium]